MRAIVSSLSQKNWDQSATACTRDRARDAPSLVADKVSAQRSHGERMTAHDLSCRTHEAFGACVARRDRTRAHAFATLTISSRIFTHTRTDAMFRPEIAQQAT